MDFSKLTNAMRKAFPSQYCGAVIVAAGNASRMGGIDKVMAPLGGEPMILRSVRAFENCETVKEIVVVTRPDLISRITDICAGMRKVRAVVAGGADRPESVRNGLSALSGKVRLAAIHDGARPLISQEVIYRTIRAARDYGAAAPGIPVKDTVKTVSGGLVTETPDRSTLRAIQTPQVFDMDLLKGALEQARKAGATTTDDCSAVERLGMAVRIVEGDERNIKVTTPMDLVVAQLLLEEKS